MPATESQDKVLAFQDSDKMKFFIQMIVHLWTSLSIRAMESQLLSIFKAEVDRCFEMNSVFPEFLNTGKWCCGK